MDEVVRRSVAAVYRGPGRGPGPGTWQPSPPRNGTQPHTPHPPPARPPPDPEAIFILRDVLDSLQCSITHVRLRDPWRCCFHHLATPPAVSNASCSACLTFLHAPFGRLPSSVATGGDAGPGGVRRRAHVRTRRHHGVADNEQPVTHHEPAAAGHATDSELRPEVCCRCAASLNAIAPACLSFDNVQVDLHHVGHALFMLC